MNIVVLSRDAKLYSTKRLVGRVRHASKWRVWPIVPSVIF